jgi:hypothetical protein
MRAEKLRAPRKQGKLFQLNLGQNVSLAYSGWAIQSEEVPRPASNKPLRSFNFSDLKLNHFESAEFNDAFSQNEQCL